MNCYRVNYNSVATIDASNNDHVTHFSDYQINFLLKFKHDSLSLFYQTGLLSIIIK